MTYHEILSFSGDFYELGLFLRRHGKEGIKTVISGADGARLLVRGFCAQTGGAPLIS